MEQPVCEMCEYSPGAIYQHATDCYDPEDDRPNLCSGTGAHYDDCRGNWVPCPACQPQPERVLIYGSRTWRDPEPIKAFVDSLPVGTVVVHGAQRSRDPKTGELYGADYFADLFAGKRGLDVEPHPAKWGSYGRRAGPIRNEEMAHANLTQARGFRSVGESRGTDDMTRRLEAAGVPHEVTVR